MSKLLMFLPLFVAVAIGFAGTPIIRRVALRYGMLDLPDGLLKKHTEPVPYMGGVIIYFSMICSLAVFSPFTKELLGILYASSILLIVGLFDDLRAMTPGVKFLFQILATYILLKSGIQVQLIFIPAWANILLSFFLILTCINAFNIIDIADGLAASIGLICSLTLFTISVYGGDPILSVLSICFAGSLLGFLKFNWEPARIYLGDSGSMVIGLIIGSLTIMMRYTLNNRLAFLSAFLILGIPLFDLTYVVVLRFFKGKSPFRGSPDHIALRMKKYFQGSTHTVVSILVGVQLLFSILALIHFFSSPRFTVISTGCAILFMVFWGAFFARVKME